MSDTIRINTTPNGSDKYVKVKLDQEFDFIEILSLKLSRRHLPTILLGLWGNCR
jgi:hypothetical protein